LSALDTFFVIDYLLGWNDEGAFLM